MVIDFGSFWMIWIYENDGIDYDHQQTVMFGQELEPEPNFIIQCHLNYLPNKF